VLGVRRRHRLGSARLNGQARALLDEHTAVRGPGTGWDLREYRHSALTHLGEQGASLLMLMAKSRHKKPENVRRYFKTSPEAISELRARSRLAMRAAEPCWCVTQMHQKPATG